ncbi:hypothetical protein F503_00778 [Ophiostoma piceae UAMH 11346]|uniref:Uncharacterized protein n=1 Tax=Ophiostoma piceae (strain UAMH 11346) TaxID=1262450 RepID=S3D3Q9_OPHP1|nr:hypothetical protein F503_00778 [Ophiostoma piceae UAMH 11346]
MADVIVEPAADQAPAQPQEAQSKMPDDNTPLVTPPSPTPTEAVRPAQTLRVRQKTYRTRATCPDPGSLYDILRENCGRSLFVLPILWTDIHPRLLRTDFIANEPILDAIHLSPPMSSGTTKGTRSQPSSADEELSCDLTSLLSAHDMRPFSKSRAIKNVLSTLFQTPFSRPKSNSDLDLHFGDRVFRKAVRIPVLWSSPSGVGSSFDSAATRVISSFGHASSSARENNDFRGPSFTHSSSQGALDGPTVAYINRSHLSMIRQNLFRIVPGPEGGDVDNTPVSRLQYLRSKQLMPTDRDRDPYLMGVFLGMAQAHFYESAPSRIASQVMWWNSAQRNCRMTPVTEFRDVKLRILTHDDETSDFMVYTTTVTADFLRKFAEPTKNTETSDEAARRMKIELTRVPVWPILGLRARLGKALGTDLVGDLEEKEKGDGTDFEGPVKDSQPKDSQSTEKSETSDKNETNDKNGTERARKELLSEDRGTRVDSLKRKRSERKSYAEVLSGSTKGVQEDVACSSGSSTPSVTSPMSPQTKRRQTRSLSSSLAVF